MILGPFLLLGLLFVCESHANNLIQRQSEGTSRSQGPEYISKPNKYCKAKIAEYSTLSLAQQACKGDAACKAVGDHQCDGRFWTCENPNLSNSSSGSCSWLKLKAAPTCGDSLMNQDETGVDCGGSTCPACVSEYISKPKKYCEYSSKIAEYSTLQLAQQACTANDACKAVTDYQCNGGFWTCKNPNLMDSSSGSCSWLKAD